MPKTSSITLYPTKIEIVRDPAASNFSEIYPTAGIISVTGVFNQKPVTATPEEWCYRYNTMTVLTIEFKNKQYQSIELQEVSNKPTWNLGTPAALQQAITDIKAIL